jgi:hypothetical protein
MSERTTGATEQPETPEQLIAWSIESETGYDPIWCRGLARECVQSLTSNGMVIAPESDVITSDQRAAIGRVIRSTEAGKLAQTLQRSGYPCVEGSPLWEAADEELAALNAITDADVAVIRAIANGGAK